MVPWMTCAYTTTSTRRETHAFERLPLNWVYEQPLREKETWCAKKGGIFNPNHSSHDLFVRGQKINANFFCANFFENPSGHGRPRQKLWTSTPEVFFLAVLPMGRNFLTPRHPGVRVRNVRGKSGPKSLLESGKIPKEIQHKDLFFALLSPPSKFLVFAFSYISKSKTAWTQRISWVKGH